MRASNSFITAAFLTALLALAGGATGSAVQAQQSVRILRMGQYDKSSEVVVQGTIVSIQRPTGTTTLPRGTYLTLQSTPLTLNVHMGLFSAAAIPFKAGDSVSVTGSLMTVNGTQILLARQVQSSTQTLTVRTAKGFVVRPHPGAQSNAQISGGLQ